MIETTGANLSSLSQPRESMTARSSAIVPLALFAAGTASACLYFWGRDLHRFTQWIAAYVGLYVAQLGFYAVACYVVLRWSSRSSRAARWATISVVILFAAGFRATLVSQRPYLSGDVYRYVWDGHLQAAGINPYRYAPGAPELNSLRDDRIFPNLNAEDRQWLSPYPPAAQIVFFAVSRIRALSVTAFKTAMASFDLITVVLLMLVLARGGLDPARAIIFAWHPLVIFEGSHSGHIESAYIAFLAFALLMWTTGKHALTGVSLGLATLVKFYPALLLPVFFVAKPNALSAGIPQHDEKQSPARFFSRLFHKGNLAMLAGFGAAIVVAYAPYWGAGGNLFAFVRGYVEEEGFVQSGARYFLLEVVRKAVTIPTNMFLIFAVACLSAIAVRRLFLVKRDASDLARGALALIGTYLLLSTPRYAWYYVWLLPFLCFAHNLGWLYLASASALLYLVWYTPLVYPEVPFWLGAAIYLPTLAFLVWNRLNKTRRTEESDATSSPS